MWGAGSGQISKVAAAVLFTAVEIIISTNIFKKIKKKVIKTIDLIYNNI